MKNLSDLTLTQKNALIHTRVMQRHEEELCSGEVVDVHEEWFCLACGHKGRIGEDRKHVLAIPNYFQSLAAAWRMFDGMGPLIGTHIELWRGAQGLVRCIIHDYPMQFSNTIAFSQDGPAEAICKAVLQALHIIGDKEEIIE